MNDKDKKSKNFIAILLTILATFMVTLFLVVRLENRTWTQRLILNGLAHYEAHPRSGEVFLHYNEFSIVNENGETNGVTNVWKYKK
jgi:hypothetical protein